MATYTNANTPARLEEEDLVEFTLRKDGESITLRYEVASNYLAYLDGHPNRTIFQFLGVNENELAEVCYDSDVSETDWPETCAAMRSERMSDLTSLVNELFRLCDQTLSSPVRPAGRPDDSRAKIPEVNYSRTLSDALSFMASKSNGYGFRSEHIPSAGTPRDFIEKVLEPLVAWRFLSKHEGIYRLVDKDAIVYLYYKLHGAGLEVTYRPDESFKKALLKALREATASLTHETLVGMFSQPDLEALLTNLENANLVRRWEGGFYVRRGKRAEVDALIAG